MLLQLLTFSTPGKEFRLESRNEALCALGKLAGQVFRYIFSGAGFKFLHLLTCRKALKSFMVTTAPLTNNHLLQKIHARLHVLPLHQNHIYTDLPPLPLWTSFSELFKVLFSWAINLILSRIKLNSQLSHSAFF